MKKAFAILVFFCIVVNFISCGKTQLDTITQVSTIDAILAGAYDGIMTCRELISYGDFGIGTFNGLDGEMVLLNGNLFQIRADGKVHVPKLNVTTPFASVVEFNSDISLTLNREINFSGLERIVDKAVNNTNIFCAVKVKGRFAKIKTRSVPAQNKPYPPLTEVTKNQPVFNLEDISGTIVGFRTPYYVKGICVQGYHLHLISDDFNSGGHVLEFTLEQGSAEIDICNCFLLILPEGENDFSRIDLSRDRSKELDKAER